MVKLRGQAIQKIFMSVFLAFNSETLNKASCFKSTISEDRYVFSVVYMVVGYNLLCWDYSYKLQVFNNKIKYSNGWSSWVTEVLT
jgi:hypothetical protein